ncbi:uncharacterized protein EV420DRAFT_1524015 [Desarmillaria tabescens]|uniref:SAP domain-containing protein n=1 Tax=Armillaria tabescens TaxID=1929756 RepID=A0AA39TXG6_ARMTA|nr:uncharacterized protein EV420DRAFT_1524015 [Desarmillaria tabescens]KAK0462315.1 hypothetical protein EV420DRAFT_1524015 [Desarmillaria tabescens]
MTVLSRGKCRDQGSSTAAQTIPVPATVLTVCLVPSPTAPAGDASRPSSFSSDRDAARSLAFRLLVSVCQAGFSGGDTNYATAHHGSRLATGLTLLGSFFAIAVIAATVYIAIARRQARFSQQQRRASTSSFGRIMDLFPLPPPLPLLPTASSPSDPSPEPPLATKYAFPRLNGKLDKNGDFETEEIDLSLANKTDWFVDLCQRYSLPSYGTKAVRRDRLMKFSQSGMAKWKSSLFTPARIPHKGVRNGGVTKRKPTRREHRILQASSLTSATPPVIFATERSKDTRSQTVVDRILPWAHSLLAKMAQTPPTNPRHTHLPERKTSGTYIGMQQIVQDPFENPVFAQRVASIVDEHLAVYRGPVDAATETLPISSVESPRPSMDLDTACLGLTTASNDSFPTYVDRSDSPTLPSLEPPMVVTALGPEIPERAPVPSDNDSGSKIQCVLIFADGSKMLVHQRDYWNMLYKYNKTVHGEWKTLKNDWMNWKFFMEAYRASGTPEAFWATYSDSQGQRLKYSRILQLLLKKHKASNVAEEAKRTFDKGVHQSIWVYEEGDVGPYDKRFEYRPGI